MGIHTGKAEVQADGEYHGYLAMSRVDRIMSVAHDGQTLLSNTGVELVRGELPEGITLLDLKEHRLKGMLLPEHLWQVVIPDLPRDFPPLASLNDIPNNLPTQLTSFIGREKEIAEVKQELSHHRLVTLTGSGGTGKTRLSLQVAAELLDQFEQDVWFVELAPLSDPELIPQTIQNTMGLVEQKGISILQALQEYLQEKKVLLVLDNCEHLIEACAHVANELLSHSIHLKILASSREALGVQGEVAWRVPSLSLPDTKHIPEPEELSQYEAVKLFIERASLVNLHFEVNKANAPALAQVCFRLGGIPLAIELAAARIKALSVEQINARLDNRFRLLTGGARTALPRQQTLRALIDWSYNLLTEKEKTLFRRLAVFVGGWSLEAAESVCADEQIDSYEILDLMTSLVDKSLVHTEEMAGEVRYSRLETIRQYAREKFFDTEEVETLRDSHLQYYVELAERAEPEIRSYNQVLWVDRLEAELDNIRSALEWAQERNQESFLRLASAPWRFYNMRGHLEEGIEWLTEAVEANKGLQTKTYSTALARISYCLGYEQLSEFFAKQTLEVAKVTDDKTAASWAYIQLSFLHADDLDKQIPLGYYDEALAITRDIKDYWSEAIALLRMGEFTLGHNPTDPSGKVYMEEGLNLARLSGDNRTIHLGLSFIANIAMMEADVVEARKLTLEILEWAKDTKHGEFIVNSYMRLSFYSLLEEDIEQAEEFANKALRFAELYNVKRWLNFGFSAMAFVCWSKGETDQLMEYANKLKKLDINISLIDSLYYGSQALIQKAELLRARSSINEHLNVAWKEKKGWVYCDGFELFAAWAAKSHRYEECARFMGVRSKLRETTWVSDNLPVQVRLREKCIADAREALGEEAFNQAWEAGRGMSPEKAIQYALKELGG